MIEIDPLVVLIACGIIVAVFLRALWHKLSDFGMFKAVFADYDIVPKAMGAPVTLALALAETAIVAGLVFAATRPAAAVGAIVLLAAYAAAIAINLRRGRYLIDCGCGGPGHGLSWFLVARNAVLMVIAAIAIVPATARAMSNADAVLIALSVVTVWLLILAVEQAGANDAHRQFLRNSRNRG
jgi:hypothetical protein